MNAGLGLGKEYFEAYLEEQGYDLELIMEGYDSVEAAVRFVVEVIRTTFYQEVLPLDLEEELISYVGEQYAPAFELTAEEILEDYLPDLDLSQHMQNEGDNVFAAVDSILDDWQFTHETDVPPVWFGWWLERHIRRAYVPDMGTCDSVYRDFIHQPVDLFLAGAGSIEEALEDFVRNWPYPEFILVPQSFSTEMANYIRSEVVSLTGIESKEQNILADTKVQEALLRVSAAPATDVSLPESSPTSV